MKLSMTLLLTLLLFLPPNANAHTENVGLLKLENFEEELYVTAVLDKRFLSYALFNEADCAPINMLSSCGSSYLKEHVQIKINGALIALEDIAMNFDKSNVTFQYKMEGTFECIQTVTVESDYMLSYSEHAVLRVVFDVVDFQKYYSMSINRKTINIQTNLSL